MCEKRTILNFSALENLALVYFCICIKGTYLLWAAVKNVSFLTNKKALQHNILQKHKKIKVQRKGCEKIGCAHHQCRVPYWYGVRSYLLKLTDFLEAGGHRLHVIH